MTEEELDRLLSLHPAVQPSSDFAVHVLAAVHQEAAEPPPLRFPWVRFAICSAACAGVAGAATALLSDTAVPLAAIAPELSYAAAALFLGLGLAAIPRVLSRS